MARNIEYISKLGLLTDDEIQALDFNKLKKFLLNERSDIYQDVVYNRLKENPKEFVKFFATNSGFVNAVKPVDNTVEFQLEILKKNGAASVMKMRKIYPEALIELNTSCYMQNTTIKTTMNRCYPKSKINYVIEEIIKKKPYIVRSDAFRCIGFTQKHYMTAVKKVPDMIRAVPRQERTSEMYDATITCGTALGVLPEKERTFARCWKAVQLSSSALQYVPDECMTQGMCEMAVNKSFSAMKYVPKEMQSAGMKLKALMKNKNAKKYIKVLPTKSTKGK